MWRRARRALTLTLCLVSLLAIIKDMRSSKLNDNTNVVSSTGDTGRHLQQEQKLNVLTFGGSTTWGAGLESKLQSYPSLLAQSPFVDRSDNLAIRASSAMWPAMCLQSLVSEVGTQELDYHAIILEFSITGLTGVKLLLERLRRRYPDSVLIYVDLYSNRRPGWSNCVGISCRTSHAKQQGVIDLVSSFGAHFLQMPRPADPMHYTDVVQYFAADHHHLSARGHSWVAQQVLPLLNNRLARRPQLANHRGDRMEGDQCANWFWSGSMPSSLSLSGGRMVEFAPKKYAYEISDVAHMEIAVDSQRETPLIAVFMTKGDPSLYPMVQATMTTKSPVVINPLNRRWSDDHVTWTQIIGMVKDDVQRVDLRVLEATQYPFRLIGLVMCAACEALNYDLTKACRHRGCIHTLDD